MWSSTFCIHWLILLTNFSKIVGCDDPYIHGAMALFNVCDEDTAELFDHGKGHTVPRDARTLRELGDAVQRMVSKTTTLVEGFEDVPPTARL